MRRGHQRVPVEPPQPSPSPAAPTPKPSSSFSTRACLHFVASVFLLLLLVSLFIKPVEWVVMQSEEDHEMLPRTAVPHHYAVTLTPDLVKFTFAGEERVELDIKKPVNSITLNAVDLVIRDVFIHQEAIPTRAAVSIVQKDECATFTFEKPLMVGPATLHLRFDGSLNDQMKGFYRSKYVRDGRELYLATTQFEPTDARRALPCWDEPEIKATFDVTLVVSKDLVAISNMPIAEVIEDQDVKVVRFETTPIMSTYLLAFIVGEFEFIETHTTDGVKVRVYTGIGKTAQGEFALDCAVKVLPFYKDYFGSSYPLPKIDLVAIPDFAAGAMENWGCVTYRESALLFDPEHSSAVQKEWVAIVVAHELAHQWFGNLVTMHWWSDLWLNEGFATWCSYLAVDYLMPQWNMWDAFVFDDVGQALLLDGMENSHPIEVPVRVAAEIEGIFDAISYSKGCAVIHMLENFVGAENFKKGLQVYLKRFEYRNARTIDLWNALSEQSGQDVSHMMDSWTRQTGYPVVTVEEGAKGLKVHQERFVASPLDATKARVLAGLPSWHIPIFVSSSVEPSPKLHLVTQREGHVMCHADAKWVLLNPDQHGFYRVRYPVSLYKRLMEPIRAHELAAVDRLGLIRDAHALAKGGYLSPDVHLDLLSAFIEETDPTVWTFICSALSDLDALLHNEAYYDHFRMFGRKLLSGIAETVGWDAKDNESHLVSKLRPIVIRLIGWFGDEATTAEAKRRLDSFLGNNCQGLHPDMRAAVYRLVLANGDANDYARVKSIFFLSDLNEEKTRVLSSLGRINDPTLLVSTLDFSLSEDVRAQDTMYGFVNVAMNRKGTHLAWNWFKENFGELFRRYGQGFIIGRLVKALGGQFRTEKEAQEIEAFFTDHPVPAAQREVQLTCEAIRAAEAWLEKDRDVVGRWLDEHMNV
eukprot:TRINITY_DN113_c2_g1_i1.p1 TRINITY_DN113_c2_g1~~TRINITY_DN113_c2_g1_i1.p1  ORF type:complete len:923 (-),score=205.70 TRINITY_DN113_c2_g1_i1:106-2874(-)